MAFVRYNESLYRTGHRMFGLTDPFTASHGLSGINHSYGGFGPWMLHGGNQPFTERGGERLSGLAGLAGEFLGALGTAALDGSVVNYNGTWQSTATQSPQDVINAVTSILLSEGLQITKSSTNAGMLANTKIAGLAEEQTFNVSLQIFVNTGQGGFGDANDVVGMIANAVWQATQKMPLAGTAPTVVPPGGGAPLGTGQPPGPGPGVFSDQQPTDFATWFENNALWIGLGIGALVLLPKVL